MLQAGVDVPYAAVRHQIGEAVQVVVHMTRTSGQRLASELLRVVRYVADADRYDVSPGIPHLNSAGVKARTSRTADSEVPA